MSDYNFPQTPSVKDLDDHNVPFLHRDQCAGPLIAYYQCLDKGTSFCAATKDEFYKCQYYTLKKRLDEYKAWVYRLHVV